MLSSMATVTLTRIRKRFGTTCVLDAIGDRVPGSHEPPQYAVVLADADTTVVHLHDLADASPRFLL
jgi:hypothetical protein